MPLTPERTGLDWTLTTPALVVRAVLEVWMSAWDECLG